MLYKCDEGKKTIWCDGYLIENKNCKAQTVYKENNKRHDYLQSVENCPRVLPIAVLLQCALDMKTEWSVEDGILNEEFLLRSEPPWFFG